MHGSADQPLGVPWVRPEEPTLAVNVIKAHTKLTGQFIIIIIYFAQKTQTNLPT